MCLWNHVESIISVRVCTRYVCRSSACRRRLRQLIAERFLDPIHVDSLDLTDYLHCSPGMYVISARTTMVNWPS